MPDETVIRAKGLTRVFQTYRKQPGLLGALKGLVRREYEPTVAVNDVNFTIQQGECVGFLGPNGAGKTTTLKMLAGLLHPTSGEASVLGFVPWKRETEYRRQFALLLGQKNQLWWDLPARESLALNAKIYRISNNEFGRRLAELTGVLGVRDRLDVMVRELSLGERTKFELIAALLHRPKVLFLDEPTIGLDVVSQQTVREFLRDYNRAYKTTILLTSHYMSDIEALCPRAIIINEGSLFFDGSLSEVMDRFAEFKYVSVRFAETSVPDLSGLPGEVLESARGRLRLKVARAQIVPVCKLLLERCQVEDLTIHEVSAEEVIRNIFIQRNHVYATQRARGPSFAGVPALLEAAAP